MAPMTDDRTDADRPSENVTQAARDKAGQLKDTSAEAARQVAETVKDKASDVTSDLGQQTRRLAGQTRDELVQQASRQKERATHSLRSLGDELRGMAEHGQSGIGAQLAQRGADITDQAVDFLQKHEPGDLLEEARSFARRKPGTFLLAAAAAGVAAGRLTRALAAGDTGYPTSATTTGGESPNSAGGFEVGNRVPPATPTSAPAVAPAPEPASTPAAPDPDVGAPVTPRFGPGSGQ